MTETLIGIGMFALLMSAAVSGLTFSYCMYRESKVDAEHLMDSVHKICEENRHLKHENFVMRLALGIDEEDE